MNDPLVMVERWSSSPTISTDAGSRAVSSQASRRAVARRSASPGSMPPPGKLTSPLWERRWAARRVRTTHACPRVLVERGEHRRGPGRPVGQRRAERRPGAGRSPPARPATVRPGRRREDAAGRRRRWDAGRPRAGRAHGAGLPGRASMGRGMRWGPPRASAGAPSAVSGARLLRLGGQVLEHVAEPTGLQVAHHPAGRGLALLPLHPGGEQLGRVGGRSFHAVEDTDRRPWPTPAERGPDRERTGPRLRRAVAKLKASGLARTTSSRPCHPCHPCRRQASPAWPARPRACRPRGPRW